MSFADYLQYQYNNMRSLLIAVAVIALIFAGRYLYMRPKFMIGSNAPNFEAKLKDNSPFNLDDLRKNNVVLLDFWGSWCGPCRAENPKLVQLFDRFATYNGSFSFGKSG